MSTWRFAPGSVGMPSSPATRTIYRASTRRCPSSGPDARAVREVHPGVHFGPFHLGLYPVEGIGVGQGVAVQDKLVVDVVRDDEHELRARVGQRPGTFLISSGVR